MKYSQIALAAVSHLSLGALAEECRTAEETITVFNPEDLDIFRHGCTTIIGHIQIAGNYTDDFILEGVTDIVGNISISPAAESGTVGTFSLPDLVNVNSIMLDQVGDVNLGSLEHAGDILLNPWRTGEVNLGHLKEAENVYLYGGWKSVDLTMLETVAGTLGFLFTPRDGFAYRDFDLAPLVIDLPALKTTTQFTVEGMIESVSVPELEKAGTTDLPERDYGQGLRINIQNPIDLEFPKLRTIGQTTQVYGNVSRISLPALGETDTGIEFNTDSFLEIYSTIETAFYVWLWGEIKSVDFPHMVDLGSVDIAREIRPCNETLVKLWEAIPSNGPPGHETSWDWRCWPSDLPAKTDDDEVDDESTTSGNDESVNDDDTATSGQDQESSTTDTTTDSDSVSESVVDDSEEHVPGNSGAFLSPPVGMLAMLLVAIAGVLRLG